jgi:hypothetical protein
MKPDQPTPAMYPSSAAAAVNPDAEERKQMGRRALIAAAGLGVVGVVVAEKDQILKGAGNLAEAEIQNAINAGRRALASELASLEGIGIDAAEGVADITHNAVNLFVIPIADLLAGLTEITLTVAIGAVSFAQTVANTFTGQQIKAFSSLQTIFNQWKTNVAAFPTVVQSLNNVDTTQAKAYLTALKAKLEQESAK